MHADTWRLTQPWPFYYVRHGSQLVLWPQVLLSWEAVAHSCADGNISLRILVKNTHPSCTWTEYSSWKPLLITRCNSMRKKQYKNNERKPIIKPLCEPLYNSGIHHFVMLWQCSSRHLLSLVCVDGPAALSELPLLAVQTDGDGKPSFNRGHLRGLFCSKGLCPASVLNLELNCDDHVFLPSNNRQMFIKLNGQRVFAFWKPKELHTWQTGSFQLCKSPHSVLK